MSARLIAKRSPHVKGNAPWDEPPICTDRTDEGDSLRTLRASMRRSCQDHRGGFSFGARRGRFDPGHPASIRTRGGPRKGPVHVRVRCRWRCTLCDAFGPRTDAGRKPQSPGLDVLDRTLPGPAQRCPSGWSCSLLAQSVCLERCTPVGISSCPPRWPRCSHPSRSNEAIGAGRILSSGRLGAGARRPRRAVPRLVGGFALPQHV